MIAQIGREEVNHGRKGFRLSHGQGGDKNTPCCCSVFDFLPVCLLRLWPFGFQGVRAAPVRS